MTPRRLQVGLGSFALLSAAVLFNAFYLQGARLRAAHGDSLRTPVGAQSSGSSNPIEALVNAQPTAHADTASADTVRAIQRELAQRGYMAAVADGLANRDTRAAILAFEFDQGLALTADPSETLLRAIILGHDGATDAASARGTQLGPHAQELIGSVQQALVGLGFGPFKAPGVQDADTSQAITRFERDHRLPETGRISAGLIAQLSRTNFAPRSAGVSGR